MLLALDVGNSQATLGLGDALKWHHRWRLETDSRRTADEYGVLVAELFRRDSTHPTRVAAVAATCVVPSLVPVVTAMVRRHFNIEPLIVGPGIRTGMQVKYEPPTALGSDRLVDALAARERWGAPVVVVDFGTATTFNVVDSEGSFVGGAIAPGVGVAADALAEAGARLRRIDLSPGDGQSVVGRTTAASMRSGVLYGYAGLVSGLLARIDAELDAKESAEVPVIATGGLAGRIAPLVDRITHVDQDLTLDGLRMVAVLNGAEV